MTCVYVCFCRWLLAWSRSAYTNVVGGSGTVEGTNSYQALDDQAFKTMVRRLRLSTHMPCSTISTVPPHHARSGRPLPSQPPSNHHLRPLSAEPAAAWPAARLAMHPAVLSIAEGWKGTVLRAII